MSSEKITAESRSEFGKGAARRIRRENKIPAVIYGHGEDTRHVTVPGHETMLALRAHGPNALLELHVDGKVQLALTKQVQVDDLRQAIEHIDFVAVRAGEKVTVDVPIVVEGEAAPGTFVTTENTTITVEAEATHVPESIEVSVEGAEAGTQITAAQLNLPKGTTLAADGELLIVHVTVEKVAEEPEEETEGDEAEGETAEATEDE